MQCHMINNKTASAVNSFHQSRKLKILNIKVMGEQIYIFACRQLDVPKNSHNPDDVIAYVMLKTAVEKWKSIQLPFFR